MSETGGHPSPHQNSRSIKYVLNILLISIIYFKYIYCVVQSRIKFSTNLFIFYIYIFLHFIYKHFIYILLNISFYLYISWLFQYFYVVKKFGQLKDKHERPD